MTMPPLQPAFCASPLPIKRPRLLHPSNHCFAAPICSAARPASADSSFPPHISSSASLARKVQSSLLASEQQSDLYPAPLTPLPVQLDLLNYHARIASRRRSTRGTARRLYRRCVEINSADGRAWLGLARLSLAEGDISAARRTFGAGVKASRQNAHLLQAWGVLEEKQGVVDRAKGLYEAAVRADSTHAPSWVALGLWYRRVRKDHTKARQMFERGAEADPSNYYVWHVLGVLEKDCRRFSVARECFRRGVEANPNNAATYVIWGSLEERLGNLNVARKLFEKAHIANPRNTHAYVSHAICAERAGDIPKAISLLESAIAIRPNDPGPRQTLGLVEFRRGCVEGARNQFKAALRVDNKHGPTWHAWACVESALGTIDRARELFQEAVWAAPRSEHVVRTWHAWATLELEEGNAAIARRYFAHGLEVEPRSVPLLEGLATVEAIVGNMPQARDYMETCIRMEPNLKATWRLYEELEKEYGSAHRAQLVYERFVVISRQVDERLVVGKPLPGDYAAGGMWIDALELKPTESAFEAVMDSDTNIIPKIIPFGKDGNRVQEEKGIETVEPSMQSKVTVSRRSTQRQKRTRINPLPPINDQGSQGISRMLPKPVLPPNMPFAPPMPF